MSFDRFFPNGSHIRSCLYEVLLRKTLPLRDLEGTGKTDAAVQIIRDAIADTLGMRALHQ